MSLEKLLSTCKQAGIIIRAEGGKLKVKGDESAVVKLLPTLKAHKQILLSFFSELERDYFEERAAIAQYDGGMSKAKAEAQAIAELEVWRTNQTYH